jgi:hypothetical protein
VQVGRCVSQDFKTEIHSLHFILINIECTQQGQYFTWYSETVTPWRWPIKAETCRCANCNRCKFVCVCWSFIQWFSDVFSYIDVIYNLLQTKDYDILYCEKKIKETQPHTSFQYKLVLFHRKIRLGSLNEVVKAERNVKLPLSACRLRSLSAFFIVEVRFSQFEKLEYLHLRQRVKHGEFQKQFAVSFL